MQIVLTLRTYLVSDLQNPLVKILIWQDTHIYETQISGETVLHKVYEVYVVYKQGLQVLSTTSSLSKKNEFIYGISIV